MNQQDLSGKIVFKVRLDKEIKKIVIHNDDINYNELLLMMQRIFAEKIKTNDQFTIKYTDEENDLITLSNDSDVLLAIQSSKILKLTIFMKDNEEDVEELKPADVVKELQHIRSSIDRFLDRFDRVLKLDKKAGEESRQVKSPIDTSAKLNGFSGGHGLPLIKNDAHREFDPLNRRSEPDGIGQLKNSRAGSPDSISSSTDIKRFEHHPTPTHLNGSTAGQGTPIAHPTQFQQQQQLIAQPPQPAPAVLPTVQQQYQPPLQSNMAQGFQPQPPQQQQQQQQKQPGLQRPPQAGFQGPVNPESHVAAPGQMYQPPNIAQQQQPGHTGPIDSQTIASHYPSTVQQHQVPLQQQGYGQYMPPQQQQTGQQPQQFQQSGSFHNIASPQQQQQQQQAQQPGGYPQQPLGVMPPMGGMSGANPFSKSPGATLARPPSATVYQQGYK